MMNTSNYRDALLICDYDYGQRCWGNVPNDIWQDVVTNLHLFSVTSFGLQDVQDLESIQSFSLFQAVPLQSQGIRRYKPYHGESSDEIMSFEIDGLVKSAVLSEDFDQWNRGNDDLCVDELIFFTADSAKILVVPYENIIKFFGFSERELQLLVDVHRDIGKSLYDEKMNRLKINGSAIM